MAKSWCLEATIRYVIMEMMEFEFTSVQKYEPHEQKYEAIKSTASICFWHRILKCWEPSETNSWKALRRSEPCSRAKQLFKVCQTNQKKVANKKQKQNETPPPPHPKTKFKKT